VTEPNTPVLDPTVLAALRDSVGGDEAFVVDLIETYLGDAGTQVEAIEAAIESGDAESLVRPAHTLKSASLTVGAMRLGELARSVEQRARSGEAAGMDREASAVRDEWQAANAALRDWLAQAGSTR
jgi:HPt (histidine-containing phosphotransfer) domain-containing protein